MQTTKISILAAIAALIITSCEQQVQMVTEINRDGTCTRQISTKEKSGVLCLMTSGKKSPLKIPLTIKLFIFAVLSAVLKRWLLILS